LVYLLNNKQSVFYKAVCSMKLGNFCESSITKFYHNRFTKCANITNQLADRYMYDVWTQIPVHQTACKDT
jgi:hypothetical protein